MSRGSSLSKVDITPQGGAPALPGAFFAPAQEPSADRFWRRRRPFFRVSREVLAGFVEGFYERIAASHQGRIYKPSQVRHMKPVAQRPHAIRSPATITKIPTTKIQCVAAL